MRYNVTHTTHYAYESDVSVAFLTLRLQPRELPWQRCLAHHVESAPAPAMSSWHLDYHGNQCVRLDLYSPHSEFEVTARSQVELTPRDLPDAAATPPWEEVVRRCGSHLLTTDSATGEFVFDSAHIIRRPEYADYAATSFTPGRPLMEALRDFTARMFKDFTFDPRATTVATPVAEVFKHRRGVCQDFAHLAIACLRSLGLPARYVSGYLETLPPPGQTRLIGADASHAWISAWCPGFGWIDADPTNNLLPGPRHITVGWGQDFADISPVRGVLVGGGAHTLNVSVDVEPLG
ncbi:MAG: transglutaminase family protein [Kiritimatiellia bacterium]